MLSTASDLTGLMALLSLTDRLLCATSSIISLQTSVLTVLQTISHRKIDSTGHEGQLLLLREVRSRQVECILLLTRRPALNFLALTRTAFPLGEVECTSNRRHKFIPTMLPYRRPFASNSHYRDLAYLGMMGHGLHLV